MRVLALDTATEACSVAILTERGVCGAFEEVGRGHAERILMMVDAALEQAGLALGMLDGIAASVGPGAFTGVRISVSVAQGLAFGAGLPVVAVSTLETLACQAMRGGADQVLACLDARMGEVYWGCYRAGADGHPVACTAPAVGAATTIELPFTGAVHGIGRGFAAYPALAALRGIRLSPGADRALPDARDMVRLGAKRLEAGEGMDPAQLTPLYVRDKVALTESERVAAKGGPR
jgi:tRNA threonylcarbamoyladenosine biosynthesis protein TsaB